MTIHEQTLQICKANGIKPQRSKGQNFLIEEKYYDEVVAAADLTKADKVLEVGPGLGFLTAKLAERAGQVTAVELDNKLAELLKIRLKKEKITNVQVMSGNALDLQVGSHYAEVTRDKQEIKDKREKIKEASSVIPGDERERGGKGIQDQERNRLDPRLREDDRKNQYKIVANLPYNITSAFLRKFLSQAKQKPDLMVLLLQREVAERICAKPGQMSLLAVSVQAYATAEIIDLVPAKAFFPAPEVESAIIRIRIKSQSAIHSSAVYPSVPQDGVVGAGIDEKSFFQLVRIGFSAKRKKLSHNLSAGFHISQTGATEWLGRAGFGDNTRAQELSVDNWLWLLTKK